MTTKHSSRHPAASGGKWCRPTTRLAIYLRDGLACVWCGATLEDGAVLTLDHCQPHSNGGGNEPTNLVTCCRKCNSGRGTRSLAEFARAVAEYVNHGATAEDILRHVTNCRRRKLPRAEARKLVARRQEPWRKS